MTAEEIKTLGEKIAVGDASPNEKLSLLKELNNSIDAMKNDIADLKTIQKISNNL